MPKADSLGGVISDELARLLVSGGDERLALDPRTGLNIYGHGTLPAPFDIAMGSSTASTISSEAFAAVREFHACLAHDIRRDGEAAVYRAGIETVRARIRALLGGAASPLGIDIIVSPSGTELHLLASALLARERRPLLTITLDGSETGSAVGTASAGRHFMRHAPGGAEVTPGQPLHEGNANVTLAIRDADGTLRDDAEIEQWIDAKIAAALEGGSDCLLVVADVTKTGLIAPSLDTTLRLKARYGARLSIMVDACQLRISAATIRAYLARDMLVAITGSKFLGGPLFSGALLCPPDMANQLRGRQLPHSLGDYFSASDFPEGWAMRASLPNWANIGLLLRWHAALFEWERLLALRSDDVARITTLFARTIEQRLRRDPAFEPIASRHLDRRALQLPSPDVTGFDLVPTIFPFLLTKRDPAGRRIGLLSSEEARTVYDQLADRTMGRRAVRLGQPVACGNRLGTKVSALRLCLSARLIADACQSLIARDALLADAMHALDMADQTASTLMVFPASRAA